MMRRNGQEHEDDSWGYSNLSEMVRGIKVKLTWDYSLHVRNGQEYQDDY